MSFRLSRLRRWFAVTAIALTMLVVGMYFYARWRVHNALKDVPNKIGIEVQQSAEGFTISKSEQGRTLFTVQASKAVQFKQPGRAELHGVKIIIYGRDSSRFDQIYGADFEYDPQSGDIIAKGEVQIALEANPQGSSGPDQAPPKELKNPIHLNTSGLVFNQKTGNAYTREKVEFSLPQASGSAVGVNYVGKTTVLTLQSQVEILLSGPNAARLTANRGVITKNPREVVLDHDRVVRGDAVLTSQTATVFLHTDNTIDRVLASGSVEAQVTGRTPLQGRSEQAELFMNREHNALHTAVLSGNVQLESRGEPPMRADASRAVLEFSGKNRLDKIHSEGGVKLAQHHRSAGGDVVAGNSRGGAGNAQDIEITAPVVDFFLADGSRLERAVTGGAAQIALLQPNSNQRTLATASKFEARFGERSQLVSLHGAPQAKVVTSTPGQPDRTTTSDTLDVALLPSGGIDSIVQQGRFAYVEGQREAWADRGLYTPADQMLTLTGSPRIVDHGMTTTAHTMRFNRATGDAVADGNVKSTYNELKQQPNGALLASADPIHVTSRSMTAHRSPAVALYSGNARLWQDANIVEAPSIQFDRDQRSVVAQGDGQPVSTVLVQMDKNSRATPVAITSARLTYTDHERIVHFDGGVVAKGGDVSITANKADAFLLPADSGSGAGEKQQRGATPSGQLDRIVAQGKVVIQQPVRRAEGEKLVYAAADGKFVLTGGTSSIFDAEHGKITGDSLTFYNRDDRVLVEGRGTSPTISTTRVAR